MLSEGSAFAGFTVGPLIGRGAFGEVYAARAESSGALCALKVEPKGNARSTALEFEAAVIRRLPQSAAFPAFRAAGRTGGHAWLAMELLGPSLAGVVRGLRGRLSFSTGVRVAAHVLRALQQLHDAGFVHRDVKPSNVLLRRSHARPVALVDFGLARAYVDRATGRHLPPRPHPGFRGTAAYASLNAHAHRDLSRRDDLVSWYYMTVDLIAGPLPWRHLESRAEVLHAKRQTDTASLGAAVAVQFAQIWALIEALRYEDLPDYGRIAELLSEAQRAAGVADSDAWDWHPQILCVGPDEDEETLPRAHEKAVSDEPLLGQVNGGMCDCCVLY